MSAVHIVRTILAADAGVIALVGDRIYYTVAPQGAALPYVVLLKGGLEEEIMAGGTSAFPEERVTIACHGVDFPAVETLGNACITATRDKQGTYAGKTATVWRDGVEGGDYLEATATHRRIVGVKVRWR